MTTKTKHATCAYVDSSLHACKQPARWWIWLNVAGAAHVVVPICTRHDKAAGHASLWRSVWPARRTATTPGPRT